MPDKGFHLKFGVVVSIGLSVVLSHLSIVDLHSTIIYAVVGGSWGSVFADLVEPPLYYSHRGFFHSLRLGRILLLVWIVSLVVSHFEPKFWVVFYGSFGYTLHLLTDAMTPMRLPQ